MSNTIDEALVEHRIKPEWHKAGERLAYRALGCEWKSKGDQHANLVTGVAIAIRDEVERQNAALAEELAQLKAQDENFVQVERGHLRLMEAEIDKVADLRERVAALTEAVRSGAHILRCGSRTIVVDDWLTQTDKLLEQNCQHEFEAVLEGGLGGPYEARCRKCGFRP